MQRTLATAGLPRRVRRTLERALALYSEEVERHLVATVTDFEEELFRLAERSGTTGGGSMFDHMQMLRVVRLNRHDLVPRFMQVLEGGLAAIRATQHLTPVRSVVPNQSTLNFRNLSLVDEGVMDEGAVLHAIASRQESRTGLTLHLLGQRFGVLGAMPAFDNERNPMGPQALCRAIRHASEVLQLEHDARLLFYRTFDRRLMVHCQALIEKLDALLAEEGVMPGLSYVPMRSRGTLVAADDVPEYEDSTPPMVRRMDTPDVGGTPAGRRGMPAGPGDGATHLAAAAGATGAGQGRHADRAFGHGVSATGGGAGGGAGGAGSSAGSGASVGGTGGGAGTGNAGAGPHGDAGGGAGNGEAGNGDAGSARAGGRITGASGTAGAGSGGGRPVGPWHDGPADPATAFGEDIAHEGAASQAGGYDTQRPHTTWMGQSVAIATAVDEQKAFSELQKLLTERRAEQERLSPGGVGPRAGQALPTSDLLQSLGRLDVESPTSGTPLTIADVKNSLLAQARQRFGKPVALSPADNDTFDLLGLLYNHLQHEMRGDAPAAALIKRLQVTLLRVALQDRAFFVRPNHPARQLLSSVSDTAAKWLADDDFDPTLLAPLQEAVTHAVKHYDGTRLDAFEQSNKQLQVHVDAQVRRAETLERRHVEAARGKEKLEAAKLRVERTLAEMSGEKPLPKFSRALLNQAWADVLTLTCLRHGEGSEEWNRQLDATRQIVDACTGQGPSTGYAALKLHVESALKQVGYHDEEADAIAQRLSSSVREDEDGESRTELTMKLRARVRLGEDSQATRKPDLPPRTPHEEACYEQLRLLPFGTWIEFVTNQQGDVVRRRMSWHSSVTGNALFVNQRGQRVGEHSLDSLARMMARDQVRVVTAHRARLLDRAWHAALNALRSLTGRRDDHDGQDGHDDIAVRSVPASAHEPLHDDTAIRSGPASGHGDADPTSRGPAA
ncbi:MAG: DUF1631 family protein [Xanthomonadaceae bacterium]|nr:DUF1631 family protein [Xanthomonadaceae bacterium]